MTAVNIEPLEVCNAKLLKGEELLPTFHTHTGESHFGWALKYITSVPQGSLVAPVNIN